LTIIVNTGDDFRHLGLWICPDVDTVVYALAGAANPESGWGRKDESWRTLGEVQRLGGPDWFKLGDLDLATHLVRTELLNRGATLTAATRHLADHFGVSATVLPMSDAPAPTMIDTDEGLLSFQEWFVRRRWQPAVRDVKLPADVRATPAVVRALEKADIVVLAPSNPFVSIDPILNVYPVRAMVADIPELVLAVSPIIGGEAVKGPAAKMMAERGLPVSAQGVAAYYGDLVDVFVYDDVDAGTVTTGEQRTTATLMLNRQGRVNLAREIMDYTMELLHA
jgi:LPPG:FO 2-phospho-L-lactate transferase